MISWLSGRRQIHFMIELMLFCFIFSNHLMLILRSQVKPQYLSSSFPGHQILRLAI